MTTMTVLTWAELAAVAFLGYAIISAYVVPFVKFVREAKEEEKQRQAACEAWRENRGFPKKAAWWVSDGSTGDAIFWFCLPINVVLAIYIFFY
jgi:hypothetical protein